ncbi:hypothetical protein BOTBODRAFT_68359 [Botryobasidium botryosum FD-172 SS1]|uniref:Enoyl reductase (ER) domain-containing protein n=1 Tax=Botryobasidium botryosum (strain FD-172 SS1) TaxID=930990 RepID=A0A067MGB7_BOTB1|nr:hypothetical protein BOTBODRAFT_68359 [Botryobasidium botryosum FD-172 SS1]
MSHVACILPFERAPIYIGPRKTPVPTPNELLIKVISAAINPVDAEIRFKGGWIHEYPNVLGNDIAGVVERVGSAVTQFQAGDRVFFQGTFDDPNRNGFQEYCIVPAKFAARIPANILEDEACTIPVALMAGIVGLFHFTGLGIPPPLHGPTAPTDMILIMGGPSQLGQRAIQLARIAGFRCILTTSSLRHVPLLKRLGATHIFDRSASDLEAQIRAVVHDDLVYAYDAISMPDTQALAYSLLSDTHPGKLAVVLEAPEDRTGIPTKPEGTEWNVIYGSIDLWPELGVPMWSRLSTWLETGAITPAKVTLLEGGLNDVARGLKMLWNGEVSAEKLVVRPWDD